MSQRRLRVIEQFLRAAEVQRLKRERVFTPSARRSRKDAGAARIHVERPHHVLSFVRALALRNCRRREGAGGKPTHVSDSIEGSRAHTHCVCKTYYCPITNGKLLHIELMTTSIQKRPHVAASRLCCARQEATPGYCFQRGDGEERTRSRIGNGLGNACADPRPGKGSRTLNQHDAPHFIERASCLHKYLVDRSHDSIGRSRQLQ